MTPSQSPSTYVLGAMGLALVAAMLSHRGLTGETAAPIAALGVGVIAIGIVGYARAYLRVKNGRPPF